MGIRGQQGQKVSVSTVWNAQQTGFWFWLRADILLNSCQFSASLFYPLKTSENRRGQGHEMGQEKRKRWYPSISILKEKFLLNKCKNVYEDILNSKFIFHGINSFSANLKFSKQHHYHHYHSFKIVCKFHCVIKRIYADWLTSIPRNHQRTTGDPLKFA